MTPTIPSQWVAAINRLNGNRSFRWCWGIEIGLDESAREVVQVVANPDPITIQGFIDPLRPDALPVPTTFYPFPVQHSPFETSSSGDLPTTTLTVGDFGRTLNPYFEAGGGIIGLGAYVALVAAEDPSVWRSWTFRSAAAQLTLEATSITLEMPNVMQITYPAERMDARICGWQFGGEGCGYPVNAAAAYTTCGLTLADCTARGDDEVARNLPRLHPRRFDAFPGVPNQ